MSTPSWQRKGNTYCKYCQQWIRDTPSEKRNHERSKHHVINVQKHINNQQILERNKQKDEQRNRKILDNIERKVQSGSSDGENQYYQAFLKHQQEMEKLPSVVMENVFNNLMNEQQEVEADDPYSEGPPQDEVVQEPSESFECNDLPLGEIAKSKPVEVEMKPKTSAPPKKKAPNQPAEIGSYYDDPNFFYYEQEEEEEKKEKSEETVDTGSDEVRKKEKPIPEWKNQYSNATTASANSFGQWETIKVSKIETEQVSNTEKSNFNDIHQDNDSHEEDRFGGTYNVTDTKKRKNESIDESSKKVKTEDNAPRKPLSFSLAKKK